MKNSLGLTWAEIGVVYRLPGYASVEQFLAARIVAQVRVVGGEMDFFGVAAAGQRHRFRGGGSLAKVPSFRRSSRHRSGVGFFAALGVDAIYSAVPMGANLQPTIPDPEP